jgi:hypothetical protein
MRMMDVSIKLRRFKKPIWLLEIWYSPTQQMVMILFSHVLLHANKTRVNTSSSVKQVELNQDNASVILLIVLITIADNTHSDTDFDVYEVRTPCYWTDSLLVHEGTLCFNQDDLMGELKKDFADESL